MSKSIFNHVKISGISFIIPSNYVYNVNDYQHLFSSEKQLLRAKKMVGYGNRYFSPDNITAVDACYVAANDLLNNIYKDLYNINDLGGGNLDIDALIFVSQVPDYRAPASANVLHGMLNLPLTCSCFDINQGCSGYVHGLWVASSLIESGACKKVLLLASDNKTASSRAPQNTKDKNSLIFSSSSQATLLEYTDKINPSYYITGSDGSKYETIISPFGGSRIPLTEKILNTKIFDNNGNQYNLYSDYMDGNEVFYFSINQAPKLTRELLALSNHKIDEIDFFAIHQANKQIVEAIASVLGLPSHKYSSDTFINYGNMAGISCLSNLIDKQYNNLISNNIKTALISFGIGLSWGAALVNIDNIYCSGLKFHSYNSTNTQDSLIEYWMQKMTNNIMNNIK